MTVTLNSGKVVVFQLGEEEYGLAIESVKSIERMTSITSIPKFPSYVKGVTNLRGTVIPVIDLRIYLLDETRELTEESRIIVITVDNEDVGLIVDSAKDVFDIPSEAIQSVNSDILSNNSINVAKVDDRLILLLDAKELLTNKEIKQVINEVKNQ